MKNYTIVPIELRPCVCVYIAIAAFRRVFAPARYLQSYAAGKVCKIMGIVVGPEIEE
jgi:hypothetical protein